jgi:drug/metabolite transporter (DMT)-like permease
MGYITQALALSTISSGKCAFICSLTVVFVPLASAILYGKPIRPASLVAAAIALTGVGVLEGMIDFNELLGIQPAVADTGDVISDALSSSSIETTAVPLGPVGSLAKSLGVGKGDLLALGQPIGFGSAFMRIEHYQEHYKNVPNRVLTIAAAQCVAVGVLSFLWVLYDYHGTIPDFGYMMEWHRIAAIAWTGIVTTVFAIFLEGIALQTASATDASIAFSSEPVWASIFGRLLLNERLSSRSYTGGGIIMLACLIGALSDLQAAEKESPAEGDSEEQEP